jgi:hypothetical protein
VNPENEAKVALDLDALRMALVLVMDAQRGARIAYSRDDKTAQWALSILRFMGYDVATNISAEKLLEIFISLPGEDHSG